MKRENVSGLQKGEKKQKKKKNKWREILRKDSLNLIARNPTETI